MNDPYQFMKDRITEDNGEAFKPSRYSLKSGSDVPPGSYGNYDFFFENTFHVIQKLGAYEDIGSPAEIMKRLDELEKAKDCIKCLLTSKYGSSCEYCKQDANPDAICSNIGGSGQWCCENAEWNGKTFDDICRGGTE